MQNGWIPEDHDLAALVGKLIGRYENTNITVEVLVAMLEEKGILEPAEVEQAVDEFLRERGREHLVDQWGHELGHGLHEGLTEPDGD